MNARTAGIATSSSRRTTTGVSARPAGAPAQDAVGRAGQGGLLLGAAAADEALELRPQRGRVEALLAVGGDRLHGARQRVEALQQDVDGRAAEPALALAQQLEDVLHLVRERRHALEAHRGAHPFHRVRDAEDLVDRVAVVGALLDAHDREVERLEVLLGLGEEEREVVGSVHQALR